MTTPIDRFPNQRNTPLSAPYVALSEPEVNKAYDPISKCTIKHWQEELEYLHWENEQILLLYQLHLNYKDQSVKRASKALQHILTNQVPILQRKINKIQAYTSRIEKNDSNGSVLAQTDCKEFHKEFNTLKAQIRPLKTSILKAMVQTLPLAIL